MKISTCLRLAGGAAAALAAGAASTTNYADEWWSPADPGWGVSVQQQNDVLLLTVAVYGLDARPRWYTASAARQASAASGTDRFVGDLYETTGTFYGSAWNPAALGYRKVGTLSFAATEWDSATIAYVVDGQPASRDVTRLTWTYENFSGTYYGGWSTICGDVWDPRLDGSLRIVIDHRADNSVRITLDPLDYAYVGWPVTLVGTYRQAGHLGRIFADLENGGAGSLTFFDLEKTPSGFTGRVRGFAAFPPIGNGACLLPDGTIGGALR